MTFKVIATVNKKRLERSFQQAETAAAYASSIQADADDVELLVDECPKNCAKCADESRDPKPH
jgi:hypothetical protein